MDKRDVLSFAIEPAENAKYLRLTPVVNGTKLTDLISHFEQAQGFDIAGGFGGLIPGWFAYGPLDQYFLAESTEPYWEQVKGYYLLGCNCGEVGCWPLVCRIRKLGDSVIWDEFRQPHRPKRLLKVWTVHLRSGSIQNCSH